MVIIILLKGYRFCMAKVYFGKSFNSSCSKVSPKYKKSIPKWNVPQIALLFLFFKTESYFLHINWTCFDQGIKSFNWLGS